MSLAAAFAASLALIAQSAVPAAASQGLSEPASRAQGVAIQASASARVLRPAHIAVSGDSVTVVSEQGHASDVQRRRDAAGTHWIEFS